MALFKIAGAKVKKILSKTIDFERGLQRVFENNLDEILNITFLSSEYSTSFGGRIDTLGIDKNGAPAIIEYKKKTDDNIINQGLSYLRWLLDHKADFEMLCKEKNLNIKIDWESPRVICIAETYNKFDLDTANILPINVELLRYSIYGDDLLYVEPETYQKVKISMSGIIKKAKQQKKETLQKVYSIDNHLNSASAQTKQLFFKFRERITALDDAIIEEPKKMYIAYKVATNFVDIVIMKKGIIIYLNVKSGQLNNPHKIARDLITPKIVGHWGNGDYDIRVSDTGNIYKIMDLIKQSYKANK